MCLSRKHTDNKLKELFYSSFNNHPTITCLMKHYYPHKHDQSAAQPLFRKAYGTKITNEADILIELFQINTC